MEKESRDRTVYIEICYLEIYGETQNTRYHFLKIWDALKGIKCLVLIFMLFWMKWMLIDFKIQRNGTGNELSNIKDTFSYKY